MTATDIAAVSVAVVGLAQLVKWSGLPDRWAPAAVFGIALLSTLLCAWSRSTLARATAFDLFAASIAGALTASGVYNLATRKVDPAGRTVTTGQPIGNATVVRETSTETVKP